MTPAGAGADHDQGENAETPASRGVRQIQRDPPERRYGEREPQETVRPDPERIGGECGVLTGPARSSTLIAAAFRCLYAFYRQAPLCVLASARFGLNGWAHS
jgi:hypothetical protein